jgi:predicted NUDIX family NTP pyrophosphohydrolase
VSARVARSAGLLLYRRVPDGPTGADGGLEVLLGHMGGPFWARKEAGAWTIPKGEHTDAEDPHAAAVREFTEEIGVPPPPGPDIALGSVRQRAGKTVTVWARAGDLDPATAVSNLVEMEWPPRSGRRQTFPELDRVRWVPVAEARDLVITAQAELLDRLVQARGGP